MDFNNFYIPENRIDFPLHISCLLTNFFHSARHEATKLTRWIMSLGLSFSNVCMRPEFMTSMRCDSVYCMCGAAWSSRWLMMQLTNAKHPCVLVFVPQMDILNIPYFVTINLFYLYLMNFMFHTMLDAASDVLRVHYKSMKCDVSFFQRNVKYDI